MNRKKTAIITGAGSGIGRAAALHLAGQGVRIAAVDIALTQAEKTVAEITSQGGDALAFQCDVGCATEIKTSYEAIQAQYRHIDILVNSAGISYNVPLEELNEEDWDRTINVNLKGTFFWCKFVFLGMTETNNGGRIINLASIAGERGGLHAGADYSASKGGIIALTKYFALQGAKRLITVNAVAPGTVDTPITRRLGHGIGDIPLGRKAKPEEIAAAIGFLASKDAGYITGVTLDINGGQLMR